MIRCATCRRFARLEVVWMRGEEVDHIDVSCARHGLTRGEYDDWEEVAVIYPTPEGTGVYAKGTAP